jgi:hypothetical protein
MASHAIHAITVHKKARKEASSIAASPQSQTTKCQTWTCPALPSMMMPSVANESIAQYAIISGNQFHPIQSGRNGHTAAQ